MLAVLRCVAKVHQQKQELSIAKLHRINKSLWGSSAPFFSYTFFFFFGFVALNSTMFSASFFSCHVFFFLCHVFFFLCIYF